MKTSELIGQLASYHGPIKTLKPPIQRTVLWLLSSFVWMFAIIAYFGVRPDLEQKFREVSFWFESTPVMLIAVAAAYVSLALGVPGSSKPKHLKKLLLGFLIGWLVAFLAGLPSRFPHDVHSYWAAGPGGLCVESILELGLLPSILLFVMIRRSAPTLPGWNGAIAMLASISLAAWGTQWICPFEYPLHFLVWHLIPAWILGLFGFYLGTKFLRWFPVKS